MASTETPRSPSALYPGWSEHVLRKKYRDPRKLKESLDGIYGDEGYRVIVGREIQVADGMTKNALIKRDRFILVLPRPLSGVGSDSTPKYKSKGLTERA